MTKIHDMALDFMYDIRNIRYRYKHVAYKVSFFFTSLFFIVAGLFGIGWYLYIMYVSLFM